MTRIPADESGFCHAEVRSISDQVRMSIDKELFRIMNKEQGILNFDRNCTLQDSTFLVRY